ncbi:hypothetical protein [Parasitella parasitica]|uniref:G-protein coupled receptors family 1 profile domain-containing protein n=1 Tax=Parasitella parasitica TaxID=35722 RepID=A0A0B7N5C1_9FUNG|nr:hypothetical protein [Parasitella parasitica]
MADTEQMSSFGRANPDKLEIASELTSLACITVLALALGAKTYGEKLKSLNYGRLLVILLYACSWAFAATSIVVVSTNNNNLVSCTIGMLACDVFYSGSKIVIYAWLIERVHVVTAVKTTRLKTNQYRFHILLLCPYIIIAALMLSFRNIYLEPDGSCTIGLQDIASIPLLVNVVTVHWVTSSGPLFGLGNNRTKPHNDEPPTAEMTFDAVHNHEKASRYDIQMVEPDIVDDEDDSIISAKDSQTSGNPINQHYN